MMKSFVPLLIIGWVCLLGLLGIFTLLQNPSIYSHTLGKISHNYERTGTWDNYQITPVQKPFVPLKAKDLLQWDASIYHCISQHGYTKEIACYGTVRAAFFPLFPLLWNIIGGKAWAISILNYTLFILSIAWLMHALKYRGTHALVVYAIIITLPSSIIYIIPYSESLFLFCTTIAAVGILRKQPRWYFGGAFLLAMVRPATLFVLLAFWSIHFLEFIQHKNARLWISQMVQKGIPFFFGYLLVFLYQWWSSGSPTAFIDAQTYWAAGIKPLAAITDWSVEGFGLNALTLMSVGLPALIILVWALLNYQHPFFKNNTLSNPENYLLFTSLAYFGGLFVFSLLTSGGNFHSLFRFILCSPFFYISLLVLRKKNIHSLAFLLWGLAIIVPSIIFFTWVNYGGSRWQFYMLGPTLMVFSMLILWNYQRIPRFWRSISLVLLVICNLIWTAYLFNIYLSDGWIFT